VHNICEQLRPLIVEIDSIQPDKRNARSHPERNINTIKRSLEQYGQRKPIVVRTSNRTVEAGNGMLEAAKVLGWGQIAAVFVDDDDLMAAGFGLMDNQSALLADWDMPTLKDLLQELDTGAFDMELTGFDDGELERLMTEIAPPEDFKAVDENIQIAHECPKCGYKWSGSK